MTPTSHPDDETLLAWAIGAMPPGGRLVVGIHIEHCARCRDTVRFLDLVGGALVGNLEPAPVGRAGLDRALRAVEAVTVEPAGLVLRPTPAEAVARLEHGPWRPLVPGVDLADVRGHFDPDKTVCMLRGKAGSPVPTHGHEQIERFVVLEGGFGLDQTVYWPGDYVEADAAVTHTPFIPASGDCRCLFSLQGGLIFSAPPSA